MQKRFSLMVLATLVVVIALIMSNNLSAQTLQTLSTHASSTVMNPTLTVDDATEAFLLRELDVVYDGDDSSKIRTKDGLTIRVYRPVGTCTNGVLTRVVVRVIVVQGGPTNDGNEYRTVLEGACLVYNPNVPSGTETIWTDTESTPWAEELPDTNIDEQMPGDKRIFRVRVECRPLGGGPVTVIRRYEIVSFVCNRRPNGPAFSPQLLRQQQQTIGQ